MKKWRCTKDLWMDGETDKPPVFSEGSLYIEIKSGYNNGLYAMFVNDNGLEHTVTDSGKNWFSNFTKL